MKRLFAAALVLVGSAALFFGLLFLVGSAGQLTRLVVAAVGLGVGAVAIGFAARLFKQARREAPAALEAEILALAKREDGEVSEHELRAQLGTRFALAEPVLRSLQAAGTCRLGRAQGGAYYSFPHLQPRLAVRRCEFCQAELPLDDDLVSCPQCGGTVRTGVQRLSLSDGDAYSMDE